MWAVNPRREELAGVPCVTNIEALPEAPDAVYLAVPAHAVVDSVARFERLGAGGIVCYSAGFKEAGDAGADAELALKQAVGEMALIGPNCYGFINYLGKAALWSFEHGGDSPGYGAAIVTQSGMFSSDITMSQRSLPLAYMISAGNQAVLGLEDYLDVLCEDPRVRAIGLHIEGLQDIPRFEAAALKALRNNTPVVALKTGSSAIGSTLTVSHTGSLSGANELYDALFERTGVISVTSPAQMLETLKYLCVVGAPAGRELIGFTCSGGGATMLADHAEKISLTFPEVSETSTKKLISLLPDIATVSNPLDYTTPIWGQPERTYPVFAEALCGVSAQAAVLVQDYPIAGLDASKIHYQNDATAFAKACAEEGLPAAICATLPENMDLETREFLISQGVAPMQGLHETLNAVSAAADWTAARARILATPPSPVFRGASEGETTVVTEDLGKSWVANLGLTTPKGRSVDGEGAVRVSAEISFPVVLKMMGAKLLHKTEAGAVALALNDTQEVAAAIKAMRKDVARYDVSAPTDVFLIEEMSPPPVAELIMTLRRDAQFGFALTLGSGGVLVELVGDAKTLLLPCTQHDIEQALRELKVGKLLTGFRGREAADLPVISAKILQFCEAVVRDEGSFSEVEVNPLFVYPDHVVAVDVLLQNAISQ
jgi:acyl-CoA synthetase (NDP forming)